MDIKDLDKKQLILLTLLITFVVSIATGIVTVSLMNQMPKVVPQTINNVIQRTIEKVTTIETPAKESVPVNNPQNDGIILGDGDAIVSIYAIDGDTTISDTANQSTTLPVTDSTTDTTTVTKELGQGIIISDIGLVLVDSSILTESLKYKVILNKTDFDATVIKKFTNGFSVLKISEKKEEVKTTEETKDTNTKPTNI